MKPAVVVHISLPETGQGPAMISERDGASTFQDLRPETIALINGRIRSGYFWAVRIGDRWAIGKPAKDQDWDAAGQ